MAKILAIMLSFSEYQYNLEISERAAIEEIMDFLFCRSGVS
jgi:hypothetical protein